MGKNWLILIAIVLIIVGGIFYLNQNKTTPPTTMPTSSNPVAKDNTVILTSAGFSPQTLTIKAGQKVTWINKSGQAGTVNSNPHPVHTDYAPLNLGEFVDGATLSLTFTTPGKYGYHNHLNPNAQGFIIVQ